MKLTAGPRTSLAVDVFSLVQMNNKGLAKRLRGLVEAGDDLVCWEVKEGDSWQPLPVGVSVKLEQVRDISSSVTVAGVSYDLETMMRTADKANIRREKQMVKKVGKTAITANIKVSKNDADDNDPPPNNKSKSAKANDVKDDRLHHSVSE